jgi:hypothetical protein
MTGMPARRAARPQLDSPEAPRGPSRKEYLDRFDHLPAAEGRPRFTASQQHLIDVVMEDHADVLTIKPAQCLACRFGERIADRVGMTRSLSLDNLMGSGRCGRHRADPDWGIGLGHGQLHARARARARPVGASLWREDQSCADLYQRGCFRCIRLISSWKVAGGTGSEPHLAAWRTALFCLFGRLV